MAILTMSLVATVACGESAGLTTVEEVEAAISKELSVGASAADIEAFFKRHDIDFGWNRFANRYEGVIRDVEPFHGISVFVYVDAERRFLRAEVEDAYTAP